MGEPRVPEGPRWMAIPPMVSGDRTACETYRQEALKKKFTRARDMESSDEDGYDWGPATDL
ncbi:tight junction protein ZO-3 isoform X3 [Prionailurus iriomotensis]